MGPDMQSGKLANAPSSCIRRTLPISGARRVGHARTRGVQAGGQRTQQRAALLASSSAPRPGLKAWPSASIGSHGTRAHACVSARARAHTHMHTHTHTHTTHTPHTHTHTHNPFPPLPHRPLPSPPRALVGRPRLVGRGGRGRGRAYRPSTPSSYSRLSQPRWR